MDLLALVLGILHSTVTVKCIGWITQPKDLHLCSGQTASFRWEYDNFKRNASLITLSKVAEPPETLLVKEGGVEPVPSSSRVSFRPNAGMTLTQVTSRDQGAYSSTVYFANENNSKNVTISDEAILNVYTMCPTKQKYFHPVVYHKDDTGWFIKLDKTLNITTSMPARVLLVITLPAAVPPVSLKVYTEKRGFVDYTCQGMKTKDFNCTAGLFFTREGRFSVYLSVEYPAYPESGKTIDLNISATIVGFSSSLVVAIVIPIIVLIFLVTIIFCQRKYGTVGFWERCCDFCLGPESEENPNTRGGFH